MQKEQLLALYPGRKYLFDLGTGETSSLAYLPEARSVPISSSCNIERPLLS